MLLQNIAVLGLLDDALDVLVKQGSIVCEPLRGLADRFYVALVIAIQLLKRRPRVTGGEPLLRSDRRFADLLRRFRFPP
jgi:hypothetical protein